jgi:hypothetical protein
MPSIIRHRRTNIVTLENDESIEQHCHAGDIALMREGNGWWTYFVGESGAVDGYDEPFENYNKALWTAKAAAEFEAAGE